MRLRLPVVRRSRLETSEREAGRLRARLLNARATCEGFLETHAHGRRFTTDELARVLGRLVELL